MLDVQKHYIVIVILRFIIFVFFSFRFFGSNLRILPVRNNAEIVKGMLTIAKVKIAAAGSAHKLLGNSG